MGGMEYGRGAGGERERKKLGLRLNCYSESFAPKVYV